jgi:hypothetical protein
VHCTVGHRPDLAGLRPNSLIGALTVKHRRTVAGSEETEIPQTIA